jgi:hypothetical protein
MALALSSHEAALAHLTAAQRSLACVDLPMPALRLKRAQVVHALAHGEWRAAMAWTEQMFAVSQRLGLDEITADALLLQARCIAQDTGDVSAAGLAGRALDMAARRELLPLRWRACGVLMDLSSDPACAAMFESDSQLLCRHGDLDIGALRASSRIEPAFRAG